MGQQASRVKFIPLERVKWNVTMEEFESRYSGSMPSEEIKRLLEANGRILSVDKKDDKLTVQFDGFDSTFTVSRPSIKAMEPTSFCDLRLGDLVRIEADLERTKELQDATCGFVSGMERLCGKIGYVRGCDNQSVIVLSGSTLWAWNPQLLSKIPDSEISQRKLDRVGDRTFHPYEFVMLLDDVAQMEEMQDGHGGWNQKMAFTAGKIGCILEVHNDGDLVVQVYSQVFIFNNEICSKVVDVNECGPVASSGDTEVPDIGRLLQRVQTDRRDQKTRRKPTDFLVTQSVLWNVTREEFQRLYSGKLEEDEIERLLKAKGRVMLVESRKRIHVNFEGSDNVFVVSSGCLKPMDPSFVDMQVGDLVRLCEDRERCAALQVGHGGFNDTMALCCGKVGYIQGCDKESVRVLNGEHSFVWNPLLISRIPVEKIEEWKAKNADIQRPERHDVVAFKVTDLAVIEAAQDGHGSWNEGLNEFVPKMGCVLKRYEDGDLKVYICGRSVRLNSDLCSVVVPAKYCVPEKDKLEKLIKACNEGKVEKLQKWHSRGDLKNLLTDPRPLIAACVRDKFEVVQWLLEHGANICAPDEDGDEPLHGAAMTGHVDIARYLLRHGANVNCRNKKGITPLHWATRKAYPVLMDLLLENEADVNVQDELGSTPLHNSLRKSHRGIVKKLLATGIKLGAADNDGVTPLHLLTKDGGQDYLDALKQNMETYATQLTLTVNDRHPSGSTALHIAAVNNHLEWFILLHQTSSVDVNARDRNGLTPLHVAIISRSRQVLQYLFEREGAGDSSSGTVALDVNAVDSSGNTPLHTAVRMHLATALHKEKSELQLGEMEKIFAKSWSESRDAAVYLEFAELLTRHGASLLASNDNNETPLSLCEEMDPEFGKRLQAVAENVNSLFHVINPTTVNGSNPAGGGQENSALKVKLLRLESLERQLQCPVCLSERIKVYFQCGHAVCSGCEVRVDKCPVCRDPIVHRIVARNL